MFDLNSRQQKELLFFCFIALLFVYPIIHADFYFRDDFTRAMEGYALWEDSGRPLASIVQLLLSASKSNALLDVAPLTQIFAALLLALSAFQFNEYLKREYQQGLVFASVLFIVNPFFLYNLSYRYDAFSMTLGIFFTVLAFCLPLKSRIGSKNSILLLIASLLLYQSDINLFIALAALEVMLLSKREGLRNIFRRLLVRSGQYCIAFSIYFITVGPLLGRGDDTSRDTLVQFSLDGLASVIRNVEIFNKMWISFFSPVNALLISLLVVFVLRDFEQILRRNKKGKIQIIALLIALSLYYISLFGPMVLLQDANAGYRSMPSFYMFAPLLIVISSMARKRLSFVWLIALVLPISISYQYGAAVKNQRVYENRISTLVQYDLLNHRVDDKPIYILGSFKRAPHNKVISSTQPFITEAISPLGRWTAESFFQGVGLSTVRFHWDRHYKTAASAIADDICNKTNQVIADNSLYSIYTSDENTFVLLSTNKANYCQLFI
jgi:hypothetical protein